VFSDLVQLWHVVGDGTLDVTHNDPTLLMDILRLPVAKSRNLKILELSDSNDRFTGERADLRTQVNEFWCGYHMLFLTSTRELKVKRHRPCWSWFLDWHQLVLQLIYSDCGLRCFRYQLKIAYSPFLYSWELAPMNLCSRPKHPRRSKDLGLSDTGRSTKEHG